MRILSFDVGVVNLAYCLWDSNEHEIMRWDVIRTGPSCSAVFTTLTDLNFTDSYDIVLVERQPSNRKMIRVESYILMFFMAQCGDPRCVLLYSPKHKLSGMDGAEAVVGAGKAQYRARKQLAIRLVSQYISEHPQRLTNKFQTSKKKDDLADCFLQAESYVRDKPPLPVLDDVKPVRVRHPTEKQLASGKLTLCSLKWLIQDCLKKAPQEVTVVDIDVDDPQLEVLLSAIHGNVLIKNNMRRLKLGSPMECFKRLGLLG